MLNGYFGQRAEAFARNFYNFHGQLSRFLLTRRKAMFFPSIGVKRVRPSRWSGLPDVDGHMGDGANAPVAPTDNLDDLGQSGYPLNSMIHHGIIRTINILLLISGYLVMIPFKENFSREIPFIRFAQSVSATRNFVLVLSGPKPGRRSNGRSPSG